MNNAPYALLLRKSSPCLVSLLLVISCLSQRISAQPASFYLPSKAVQMLAKKEHNSWVYDLMAAHYSFIGQYEQALTVYDRADTVKGGAIPIILSNCVLVEAKKYIIERSRKEKIIIINEAHHQPLHRVFTQSLLDSLWQHGYRHFGLEGLADGQAVTKRGKIKLADGFYSAEPQYANMLRHALKLGFKLFSYEASGKNGIAREEEQASRIWQLMQANTTDKFLIHCGFSHVTEANHPDWGAAMAGRLKQLSGYNPFTIDQVEMSERSQPYYEADTFKQFKVNEASVLVRVDSVCRISDDPRAIDLKVIHPPSRFKYGRPNWLAREATFRYVNPKKYFTSMRFPCLIFAYQWGEDQTYVPVDLIELASTGDSKHLVLPVGSYRLQYVYRKERPQTRKAIVN